MASTISLTIAEVSMRVPIIEIGNSRGIRIPQAILKQVQFSGEIEMEVSEGKITLRRNIDPSFVPDFHSIAKMDDITIQRIFRKISGCNLIIERSRNVLCEALMEVVRD